jgi:hypothetical protein
VWQQFGNLNVGVVARQDLICLKVFAATGATSAEEKHYDDLMKLKPSTDELSAAGAWAESQGIGTEFFHELETLLTNARRDLGQSQR